MLVDVGDTRLNVEERGAGELALIALHGGPGLDHTMFGDWLDPLGDACRILLVDERGQGRSEPSAPETWTLDRYARDVDALAGALGLERYVVLGHSFGAFIALQHAVDFSGRPAGTVVSSGAPSEGLLMSHVERELERFEPVELREQVQASWAREAHARTQDEVRDLLDDQLPFHFADPRDPRIDEMRGAMAGAVYAPDVLRAAATEGYGHIEVEDRLGDVRHPVLVLAGRHDRTCSVDAAETIARGVPDAELVVLEHRPHDVRRGARRLPRRGAALPRAVVTERAERLADGLWRWATPHPAWRPGMDDHDGGWPRDVGSVLHERAGVVTIVDPLAGAEDAALLAFLDERCAGARRVVVAVTASWHGRSAAAVAGRYDADIRVHRIAAADPAIEGLERVRPFDADGEIAPGVEAMLVGGLRQGEVAYWLPGHGALVTAEVLQGRADGLRVGEDPAMASREELYAWVRALDRLPVRLVLPTHGPPASGPDAIRQALERPPWRPDASG